MALVYEGASASWEKMLDNTNYFFTTVFILEATLKLIAYGRSYFYTAWNKFDFIIVVSSILDIMINMLMTQAGSGGKFKFLKVGP